MKVEPIPTGRAKFEEGSHLRILLPPKRHAFGILFLLAWTVGWFFGERSAIQQITASKDLAANGFLLVWLAGWTLGGAFVIFAILWMTGGREVLELRSDVLVHRRAVFGFGTSRAYALEQIRAMRLGPASPTPFDFSGERRATSALVALGVTGGPIVFDYGAKTVRCGAVLDEAEAKQIIERMIQRDRRLSAA
ncbi:MAG TPA: hypothetical protein VHU40_06700 [Polyangia bacterium]|jgi:hypothetical protein|nr:hypothetical protein [Polyangia bacterium]